MTQTRESEVYIHGTSDEEQERLGLMNRLINERCLATLALDGERRVLDVGCGLGHFALAMAENLGPGATVVGVEKDARQLAGARRVAESHPAGSRFELRQGAAEDLPLAEDEWCTFDLAHTRFLLEHHPAPHDVVAEMVRAVRPGGRVVLADDDHDILRLAPECPGFVALWQAYMRLYDRNGHDPVIGRRLASLLHAAGAAPRRNDWVFYGACAGDPTFRAYVDNLLGVLLGVRAAAIEQQVVSERFFDAAVEEVRAWSELPDASLWYAINWVEGVRPPNHLTAD